MRKTTKATDAQLGQAINSFTTMSLAALMIAYENLGEAIINGYKYQLVITESENPDVIGRLYAGHWEGSPTTEDFICQMAKDGKFIRPHSAMSPYCSFEFKVELKYVGKV
jgi:hypothetical protein